MEREMKWKRIWCQKSMTFSMECIEYWPLLFGQYSNRWAIGSGFSSSDFVPFHIACFNLNTNVLHSSFFLSHSHSIYIPFITYYNRLRSFWYWMRKLCCRAIMPRHHGHCYCAWQKLWVKRKYSIVGNILSHFYVWKSRTFYTRFFFFFRAKPNTNEDKWRHSQY